MNIFARFQRLLPVPVLWLVLVGPAAAQRADTDTLAANMTAPPTALHHGAIGVGSWNTAVEFKDIVVTSNGVVLYRSDFVQQGTNGLTVLGGDWSVKDGVLRQTAIRPECRLFLGDTNWANYTLTLRARKTAGQEGFFVYFNCLNTNNWTWFDFAGWTNSLASIDQQTSQAFGPLTERVPSVIKNNVWYDVSVVLNGDQIECYLNGKLVQKATYPPLAAVFASSGKAATGDAMQKRNPRLFHFNPSFQGAVGVGTWNTAAEFRNIVVTSNDEVLYRSDFAKEDMDSWHTTGGSWTITNGVLRQTQNDFNCFATIGDTNWSNYTLTLQARKISGVEGFCVVVGSLSDGDRTWFNAGSWGNRSVEIYQDVMGRRGTLSGTTPLTVETGKWYDVRVVVAGAQVSCYLNSNLIQTVIAQVLVTTNAVYLGSLPTSDGNVLRFKLGKYEFHGKLTKDRGGPPALESGSLVQVTGTIQPGLETVDPDSEFQIFSPADVVLLQRPSWWTWQRILWFGGISLVILITVATWIAMISRRNRLLMIAQSDLEKANDELERRVQERTAELAKANVELQHEQVLLRTLLDNASDYIYFKDTDSKFVRCSVSLCKRSGLTPEQIVGQTDFDIFQEAHARQTYQHEQEIIRSGRPLVKKLEQEVHPDGRITWVTTTKMPWHDSEGKIIGTFGISCDITSIKETEAELAKAHEQLVEASRAAGMAEVATGVLHNVGNVLNSVNVSTNLIAEQLKQSKANMVGRVATLMQEHAADLPNFITNDPQGRRLAQFLSDLAEELGRERTRAGEELAGLQKNVDHIKEIVAMQQNYATVAGVSMIVKIPELLEDVLRLTKSSLDGSEVKLVKEFDQDLPEITVDQHKVVQILVNLIRNAKHACQDSPRPDKELTLRATASDGRIQISVIDNGVGILAENLTRIFAHGFTTRKNGHGYGLHSSALAAKELGGKLSAYSDGLGRGASFTLELGHSPKAGGRLRRIAPPPPDAAFAVER